MSTDGASNPLNLPKSERFELSADGRPKLVRSRIRHGVVPLLPSHTIISADLAQIEARTVATLAGQHDLVQAFVAGRDVYSDCASGLFHRPVSKELAKTDPIAQKDRDSGKETILGGGFGMGPLKFMNTARKKGLIITLEEATEFIQYYRSRYDMIPELWTRYDEAMKNLLIRREPTTIGPVTFEWIDEQARTAGIRGPNGLHLIYPRLRMAKLDDRNGGERWQLVCNQARDKYPRRLWGGIITENVVQRLARDVIVDGMVAIQLGLGLRTALQVYDEIVASVPTAEVQRYVDAITMILSRSPKWLPELPVAVEVSYGPSYGDC